MIATVPHRKIANGLKTQRDMGFETETNDCFVHALAAVTGVPYRDAHAFVASRFDRKPRKGTFGVEARMMGIQQRKDYVFGYLPFYQESKIGTRIKTTSWGNNYLVSKYQTLNQFLATHKTGRYLLWSKSHAFAVIDGVAYDNGAAGLKTQVTGIYKFIPSSQIEQNKGNKTIDALTA